MVMVATVFPGARSCSWLETPGWPLLAASVPYPHDREICACLVQKFGLSLRSTRDRNDRPVEDELSICLAPTAPAVRSALRIVDDDVLGLAEHDMWTTCQFMDLSKRFQTTLAEAWAAASRRYYNSGLSLYLKELIRCVKML